MSRSVERDRKNSINSMFASSPSTPVPGDSVISRSRRSSHIQEDSTTNSTSDTSFELESIDESPFGPLKDSSTKWTFANLIAILNTTFPDHDFSNLQPTTHNFHKINGTEELVHRFNNLMISLGKSEDTLNWIWDRIDSYMDIIPRNSPVISPNTGHAQIVNNNTMKPEGSNGPNSRTNSFSGQSRKFSNYNNDNPSMLSNHCQIFEFRPSDQTILEDLNYPYQTMWSCYWFIYNKKKKKVAFIYLTAINKVHYVNINGNRKSSFRSSRRNGIDKQSQVIGHDDYDDDDDIEMSMDYMDEDVFIDDDEIDDGEDEVIEEMQI